MRGHQSGSISAVGQPKSEPCIDVYRDDSQPDAIDVNNDNNYHWSSDQFVPSGFRTLPEVQHLVITSRWFQKISLESLEWNNKTIWLDRADRFEHKVTNDIFHSGATNIFERIAQQDISVAPQIERSRNLGRPSVGDGLPRIGRFSTAIGRRVGTVAPSTAYDSALKQKTNNPLQLYYM